MKTNIILFALAVAAVLAMVVTKEEKTYNLKPMTPKPDVFWVETGVGETARDCFVSYRKEADYKIVGRVGTVLNVIYSDRYALGLGTGCSDKTIFSIEREKFYKKMAEREEFQRYWERLQAIAEIARNRRGSGVGLAQIEPTWVTVANLGGAETRNDTRIPFHGSCNLFEAVGSYNVVVDARDLYVVRFTGRGGEGTQCPDGTMFFAVDR